MPFSSRALMREASVYRAGGWVKCWLPVSSFFLQGHILLQGRKGAPLLALLVLALHIEHRKAVKGHRVAGGFEEVAVGGDVRLGGALQAVGHLAGHKALPDELIELILVAGEAGLHILGSQAHIGGADGLVAVLGVGPGLILPGLLRGIAVSPALPDIRRRLLHRVPRKGAGSRYAYR